MALKKITRLTVNSCNHSNGSYVAVSRNDEPISKFYNLTRSSSLRLNHTLRGKKPDWIDFNQDGICLMYDNCLKEANNVP